MLFRSAAGGLGKRGGLRACDALRLSRRCLIHLLNFEGQPPPNSKCNELFTTNDMERRSNMDLLSVILNLLKGRPTFWV